MINIDNMGREVVVSGEYIRDMIKEASTSKYQSTQTNSIYFAPEADDPLDSRPSRRYHTYSET